MKKGTKKALIAIAVIAAIVVASGILANYVIKEGSQTSDVPKAEETKTEVAQLEVKKEFKIRPATWIKDEEYLMALKKFNTLSVEELKSLHLEDLEIVVDNNFSLQPGLLRIDYRASLGEIKEYIEKNASVARAEEEAEKVAAEKNTQLEKILRAKGLNIGKAICSQKEYLIALEKLNTLTPDEIKSMHIENNKIVVSWFFEVYPEDKEIRVDYKATLEKMKQFITENTSLLNVLPLKEQIGKLEKEIKEKISK